MADVSPFAALRYNVAWIEDFGGILCPPYDVISPDMQRELHSRSLYNAVRLEFGEAFPQDTELDNRYTRAGTLIKEWEGCGILVLDKFPAFYLTEETFSWRGSVMIRRSLLASVRLEEWESCVVLPHEETRSQPKEDRLRLMRATAANISPIMALYEDQGYQIASILDKAVGRPPLIDVQLHPDGHYRVWGIDESETTLAIRDAMWDRTLSIADGHHRYETALQYRDEVSNSYPDSPENFVLMALVDIADPGLLILPYHRVLQGLSTRDKVVLKQQLKRFCHVKEIPVSAAYIENANEALEWFGGDGGTPWTFLVVIDNQALLCLLHEEVRTEAGSLGECDAWVLQENLLEPALGGEIRRGAVELDYMHDATEAMEFSVGRGDRATFILHPLPLSVFQSVVTHGYRLPPKSTFFYPKLPTGLAIRRLQELARDS